MPTAPYHLAAAALAAVVPVHRPARTLPSPLYGTPRQILATIAAAKGAAATA